MEPISITPAGYQGPAQHTWTLQCDGFHEPGTCKDDAPVTVTWPAEVSST